MRFDHILRGELQLFGKLLLDLTQTFSEFLLHFLLFRFELLAQLLLQLHASILLAAHGILILTIGSIQVHARLQQRIIRALAQRQKVLFLQLQILGQLIDLQGGRHIRNSEIQLESICFGTSARSSSSLAV